jgi:Cu/Ag efflux protein CusF
MKRMILTSLVALAVSVAFISAGMAQQKPTAAAQTAASQPAPAIEKWEKVKGVIEKVDEKTREVTLKSEKENMTFSVGDHTYITETTAKLPLAHLKKGMEATVEYKKEGNKMMAEWVNVHQAMAQAKPATQPQGKMEKKESAQESGMGKK